MKEELFFSKVRIALVIHIKDYYIFQYYECESVLASSFELDLPNMLTQCIHKYRKIAKRIFAYKQDFDHEKIWETQSQLETLWDHILHKHEMCNCDIAHLTINYLIERKTQNPKISLCFCPSTKSKQHFCCMMRYHFSHSKKAIVTNRTTKEVIESSNEVFGKAASLSLNLIIHCLFCKAIPH